MNANARQSQSSLRLLTVVALFSMLLGGGCSAMEAEAVTVKPIQEVIVCSWEDDAIGGVLQDFFQRYGIRVRLQGYRTQDEMIDRIRGGYVCDLLVVLSDHVPSLVAEGLVAEIDYTNVLNFRNISADFRSLAYDPYNKYSVPYNWGTTGLIVRTDLTGGAVRRWGDLWSDGYQSRVAVWMSKPREMIAAALLALGYSVNSENPQELENALQLLLQLKQRAIWLDQENSLSPMLIQGDIAFGMGWADDYWQARQSLETVAYITPDEGAILWSTAFVIPANSPNKNTSALIINYLLEPETAAKIMNTGHYAIPNDLAAPLVQEDVRSNPAIYPPEGVIQEAQVLLPLSQAGQMLYRQVWDRFLSSDTGG